ncbi:MAG: hypothetical protein Q4C56_09030 [Peptococcaceae bacterium]|nr:hypothetical protein [Peptococcaceae bacterium]
MINDYDTILAYRKQYPEDDCAWMAPSCEYVFIDNGDKALINPPGETDEIFLDRLERSKAAGRNLFYEEWTDEYILEPGLRY